MSAEPHAPGPPPATPRWRRLPVYAAAMVAAAALAWLSLQVHLRRACDLQDTPGLPYCADDAAQPSPAQLRARIGRNPADAAAYVQLALREVPANARSLEAAMRLAPTHPHVLMLRAAAALDRTDWREASGLLVTLAEHHRTPAAANMLALLAGAGHAELLVPHVTPGSHWLGEVLAQLPQARVPFSAVLPLVVQAWRQGLMDQATLQEYVRDLKTAGAWSDAYSLWLALHGNTAPVLFNGSFDLPLEEGGFDWEPAQQPAARAGVLFSQTAEDSRGNVLDLRFTGRPLPSPLLRQHLLLGEGRYRLRGQFRATQWRMEQGLAWTVHCTAAGVPPSRSTPLTARTADWQPFDFEFVVPRGCGSVAALQLEPLTEFAARVGARGQLALDDLSLRRLP